jgi:predicted glycoside hydrolase/deacetylase ChbG (UPF0249 family)
MKTTILKTTSILLAMIFLLPNTSFGEEVAKRYVIIHSDDAGMSHSVNLGTIDAMENGIVSSCSIMVPCPWFPEFAKYAKKNPDKDYGIHLTLNSEFPNYRWKPVSDPSKVPSLVDEDGYLWPNIKQVAAHAKANEVKIELKAQIDRAKKFGVVLTHLDTHMGSSLCREDILQIYVNLGIEYDLPIMFFKPYDLPRIRVGYPAVYKNGKKVLESLQRNKLPVLDMVYQFYVGGAYEKRKKMYLDTIKELKPGVTEIIIHCGIQNPELSGITGSVDLRNSDRLVFMDPSVIKEIEEMGVEVITWKKFRELEDKKSK